MLKFAVLFLVAVCASPALSFPPPPGGWGPPPPGSRPPSPGSRPPPPGSRPPPPGSRPPPPGSRPPPPGSRPPPPPPPPQGNPGCLNRDPEANRRLVLNFYQEVFGDKEFHKVDQYVAQDIISHNPNEVDGIDSLRQVLNGPLGEGPKRRMDIRRSAVDGDLVWTHQRFPVPAWGKTFAIVDIFRINCEGKIQEHWDVMQDMDVQTNNPHPFF